MKSNVEVGDIYILLLLDKILVEHLDLCPNTEALLVNSTNQSIIWFMFNLQVIIFIFTELNIYDPILEILTKFQLKIE